MKHSISILLFLLFNCVSLIHSSETRNQSFAGKLFSCFSYFYTFYFSILFILYYTFSVISVMQVKGVLNPNFPPFSFELNKKLDILK